MPERIERDVVAIIAFRATDAATEELLEAIPEVAYLHGHNNFPKGFEDALEGLEANAAFDVVVPNAFGVKTGSRQSVRRGDLPKSIRDEVRVGLNFSAPASDGSTHVLWVTDVKGGRVTLTTDHPYAGRDLRFAGTVIQLRVATANEVAHGHAHGPGGHHHH